VGFISSGEGGFLGVSPGRPQREESMKNLEMPYCKYPKKGPKKAKNALKQGENGAKSPKISLMHFIGICLKYVC
jgi:hypothetical protein